MSSSSYDTGMRLGGGGQSSSSQRMRKKMAKPRCPLCGSRRFRRDADTSMVVCDQGHVLQGFREETVDDGESFDPSQNLSQRTRRRLRVGENAYVSKKRRSTAIRGTWSSERTRYLFYQCLQVILRMQIKSIKEHLPNCPGEDLESVCRDLWAFYVSMQDKLQPQPYLEASENIEMQTKGKESRSTSLERAKQAEREAMLQEEEDESQRFDDQLRLMGLAEEEADGETDEVYSTDAGETSAIDTEDETHRSDGDESKGVYMRSGAKNLTILTCIIYLGLITLRVPIRWNDLRTLLVEQKIPFLHAIYQLPRPMTKALPYRYAERLDGKKVPSVNKFHHVSVKLATDLHNKFGIKFPEMNALPILWRCTQDLLLPPTMYCAAKRLIAYCELPLMAVQKPCSTLSLDQEKPLQRDRKASSALDPRLAVTLQYTSVPREVVLMASLVLMIKMRYGLDGEERFEEPHVADIWSGCPPLFPWLEALEEQKARCEFQFPTLADPDTVKIDEMTTDQLDAYLDYAEEKLILEDHPNALHRRHTGKIDDLLACGAGVVTANGRDDINVNNRHDQNMSNGDIMSQLYENKKQLYPHLITLDDNQLRPGDAHSVYSRTATTNARSPYESGWVDDQYARVLQYAAKAIGIDAHILADTVYAVEMRLINLLQHRKTERQKGQQLDKSQNKTQSRRDEAQLSEEEQSTDEE